MLPASTSKAVAAALCVPGRFWGRRKYVHVGFVQKHPVFDDPEIGQEHKALR
jgi:hypothetical protein